MKFKDLLSKLNEKNELGTPATTKAYASATPSQGKVRFNPDSAVDGVALANELVQGIKAQITKARSNIDIDSDGDVDAMDKKNDNIPDETPDSKKDTLTLFKTRAAERASTKNEGVSEGKYQSQYKSKKYAIAYAKHRAKTFRDPEDGIEIWSMPDGGFDVVHNMNSNGRNHLVTNGGKKLGTIGPRQQGVSEKAVSEDIQIDESEDKSLARLRQLVRFGLMDKSKLPLITRAMGNLEKGNVTNPTERSVLFDLLDELIGIVTGDDTMFAKVRMSVQREDNDVGR